MRRVALVSSTIVVLLAVTAAPAGAHTVGGAQATNYRSEVTTMRPAVPGITVKLLELGRRVELRNTTSEDVVVVGYANEPYLRVGPGGVYENRRSPTLYQNKITTGNTALAKLPPEADPSAPPQWQRQSGSATVSWRDHRARWEGPDPPSVSASPGREQVVVTRWDIGLRKGPSGEAVVVSGRITWVPGPALGPWMASLVLLLAAGLAAGASRHWPITLSGALAFMIAADVVRLFGDVTASGGAPLPEVIKAITVGIVEVAALCGGVWAIGAIQRRSVAGLYVAMAAGVTVAFMSGFGDLLNLAYSQVPNALPAPAARAAVVVCLGLGFGVVGGAFLALRQLPARRPMPLQTRAGRGGQTRSVQARRSKR